MELLQDEETPNFSKISVLDACRTLKKAWADVKVRTIQNSFVHSGLVTGDFEEEDEEPLTYLINKEDQEVTSFFNFEENLLTAYELTDADIVEEVKRKNIQEEEEDGEEEESQPDPPPTLREVQKILKKLEYFYECQGEGDEDIQQHLITIENNINKKIINSMSKQKKITDYLY